jgi:hypothetical protein
LFDVMGWNQAAEESLKQTAACMIWIALLATLFEPSLPVSWMEKRTVDGSEISRGA